MVQISHFSRNAGDCGKIKR